MRLLRFAVAASLALVASCAASPPSYSGPYADVLDAVCGALDRCPGGIGRPIAYRSRRECTDILHWAISCRIAETEIGDFSEWRLEETVPDVAPEAADACIAWLGTASCEDVARGTEGTPCDGAFTLASEGGDGGSGGSAGLDEECSSDDDCQADLFCAPATVDRMAAIVHCAVCRPRVGEGAECQQYSRMCSEGLYCTYEPGGPRRCRAFAADGASCTEQEQCASGFCHDSVCDPGGESGDPCAERSDCRYEFYCDASACVARRANGGACTADEQCEYGNCDEPTSTCGLPEGAMCSYGTDCASRTCTASVCGAAGPGSRCSTDSECGAGLVCSWGSGSGYCRMPGAVGEACDRDEECASGWCNSASDQCGERRAIGEACTGSAECDPGICRENVCAPRRQPGESCESLDECAEPFLCRNGRCEIINLACQPARAGEMCAFFRVCDDASYCDLVGGFTCRARAGEGQECSPSFIPGIEVCLDGLRCASDASGTTRCVRRTALGAACTSPTECVDGAYCYGGTCQGDPIGRPCDYDSPCPSALLCSRDDVCVPRGVDGARCTDDEECAETHYCDFPTCAPRLGAGESCSGSGGGCMAALHCDRSSYTCQPRLAAGATCQPGGDECAAGTRCDYDGSTGYVCIAQAAAGAECSSNDECVSGECYSSFCLAAPGCVPPP
jgi:hypothetical protein